MNADNMLNEALRNAMIEASPENLLALGRAYLRTEMKPARRLEIEGRLWFQKTYGNTYHRVRVFLDGEFLGRSDVEYGYGQQFAYTGIKLALKSARIPAFLEKEGNYSYSKRTGIEIVARSEKVTRKKDL